jgi:hypothetical protein
MPVAFLGLVTPWFGAVSPLDADTTLSYSAWTHPWFGMIGPWFLVWTGGQWFGALRGWWASPSPRDWRGASRGIYLSYGPVGASPRGEQRPSPPLKEPMRAGAQMSAAEGAAALALLGLNRALFRPVYYEFGLPSDPYQYGHMPVHADFGFWCVLLAAVMFVVTGLVGASWPERNPIAARSARRGETDLYLRLDPLDTGTPAQPSGETRRAPEPPAESG